MDALDKNDETYCGVGRNINGVIITGILFALLLLVMVGAYLTTLAN